MYKTGHAFSYLLLKEIVANERLISVRCELDHSVMNHAVDEWRRRLSACVDAEGGHLKHYTFDCYSQNNNAEMSTL